MQPLKTISSIDDASIELLEAAGFRDLESLAAARAEELAAELERANSILRISRELPDSERIGDWIGQARGLTGFVEEIQAPETSAAPVVNENEPEISAMLESAPCAIPLLASILISRQIGISNVPSAYLLNRCHGNFEIRKNPRVPGVLQVKITTPQSSENFIRFSDSGERLELNTKRLRSFGYVNKPRIKLPSFNQFKADEQHALMLPVRAETNRGRSAGSRRYIRGVLHARPWSIIVGAIVTLSLFLIMPPAVLSSVLLLLSRERPQDFGWVPGWLIVFPLVLPLLGACYLIWGLRGSCNICGLKLFRHGRHRKNSKAHHVPGLGYVFPLCIHILLFRWFRCSHCGTPMRLKE